MAIYGLEKISKGFYLHPPTGFHLLRTAGWENSRGTEYACWEIAVLERDGSRYVPQLGLPTATLREAVREAEIAYEQGNRPPDFDLSPSSEEAGR